MRDSASLPIPHLLRRSTLRTSALLAATGLASTALAQSPNPALTPTQPSRSSLPATPGTSTQPSTYTAPAQPPHRNAQVTYTGGLLTVSAQNSSLNQILREIARLTGMKITGGVADDRVFGTYGPDAPAAILRTLLDGTGSNILLVESRADAPTELILTPRIGGVTPPNPNAAGFNDSAAEDEPPPQGPFTQHRQPPDNLRNSVDNNSRSPQRSGVGGIEVNPAATQSSTSTQQVVLPPVDATNPPTTVTTTPTNPDGSPADSVKTPQQIFEQLQRLRQQQQQQQATPPQQ